MKEDEVIWMHMTCRELALLLRVIWAPYRLWTRLGLPQTDRFLNALGRPANLEVPAPLSTLGAAAVLHELEGTVELPFEAGQGAREMFQLVLDVTKGGIEVEAAWRARQAEPRTALETLPEEGMRGGGSPC